jgi:hypothetical protein
MEGGAKIDPTSLEIKKIGQVGRIALNSSFPKDKLYRNSNITLYMSNITLFMGNITLYSSNIILYRSNITLYSRNITLNSCNITLSSSNTTYNTSSDPRLKNITGAITADEAKNFVMALQPKKGTWKTDGSVFQGFVSTEYEILDPKAVHGIAGATETLGNLFDQDGKLLNENVVEPTADALPSGGRWEQTHVKDIYQTLEYGSAAWCANMTAHAQYLQNTIEQLVARIEALEGN